MSALLYDPDCGFCTRAAELLAHWPVTCEVAPMSPARLAAHGIDPDRAQRGIPFVADDGTLRFGAAAIAAALRTASTSSVGGRVLVAAGALLGSAPVLPVARRVYAWVADHRHQLPGGTAACALPSAAG
ncbi:thiol-disulfide oxidoreductase DCC family protein [Kytococcus sp. Marseille-QA3725]